MSFMSANAWWQEVHSSRWVINSCRSAGEISPAAAMAQSSSNRSWFDIGHLQSHRRRRGGRGLPASRRMLRLNEVANLHEAPIVVMTDLRQRLPGFLYRFCKLQTLEVDQLDSLALFVIQLHKSFLDETSCFSGRQSISACRPGAKL